jgi:hypothetical protein
LGGGEAAPKPHLKELLHRFDLSRKTD